jgi:hypothetical protein
VRTLRFVLSILLMGTAAASAETNPQTDAQQDGLNGSVRSMFMKSQETLFRLDPAGASVIQAVPTGNVEYDDKGYRTRMGELTGPNGEFQGQTSQFVRDANGRVIERTITQQPSQEVIERDVYGPFGLVETTDISSGKPTSVHALKYDQKGNLQEDTRLDGDGKPVFRTLYRRDPNGAWTERTMWLRGRLHSHETYDPDSDFQRYEEYDDSGDVATSFTHLHDRIQSYWSASQDGNGGISMIDTLDNGDTITRNCHNQERTCDGHTRHSVYLDAARKNPSETELLSDDGKRLFHAHYEYQMDEHGNWTSRKIWVQSGEHGELILYETDSRTITYWSE